MVRYQTRNLAPARAWGFESPLLRQIKCNKLLDLSAFKDFHIITPMDAPVRQSSNFLTKHDEFIFLGIPIVILILAVSLRLCGILIDSNSRNYIKFFVLIVGLQKAHNAFSFPLIFLPEFKKWRKDQFEVNKKNYTFQWKVIAFTVTAFWIFYFLSRSKTMWQYELLHSINTDKLLWVCFWLITFWHTFSQYFGLSVLLNQESDDINGPASQPLKTALARERILYKILIPLGTVGATYFLLFDFTPREYALFLIGSLPLVFAIFWTSSFHSKKQRKKKFLFNMRLLLITFSPLSVILKAGMNVTHNFEYFFVCKNIVKKSKKENPSLFLTASALWILLIIILSFSNREALLILHSLAGFFRHHATLRRSLLVGSITVTTVHYFLDGYFFHFSDPITRKHIRPLLAASSSV